MDRFSHPMKRYRKISLILLSISAIIGLVRGYRLVLYPSDNSIIFTYPEEVMNDSLFSNFVVLGWILFFLVGVLSLLAIIAILFKSHDYGYLLLLKAYFLLFSLTNLFLLGFSFIHLLLLPLCISLVILGVLQKPKEF